MKKIFKNKSGFSAAEGLIVILVLVVLGVAGYFVLLAHHKNNTSAHSPAAFAVNPYEGWKAYISPLAKYSIRYPSTWTKIVNNMGYKDVEILTLESDHFIITISSSLEKYSVKNGQRSSCVIDPDKCLSTISSQKAIIPRLGTVRIDAVTYRYGKGTGNGLQVKLLDGDTIIQSTNSAGVISNFYGTSKNLNDAAYLSETKSQFTSNPDFSTAIKIFKSLSYAN